MPSGFSGHEEGAMRQVWFGKRARSTEDFPIGADRWPGLAPAGDLLSCVAKKEGKEGDPPPPVIRSANDCPALLPAGGRRGTRPSGSDSRAGRPRLLVRCSAGSERAFRMHRASPGMELDTGRWSPAFSVPSDVPTGGWDGRKKGFACLSPQGEFAKTPPGTPGRREARRATAAGYVFLPSSLSYNKEEGRPPGRDPANVTKMTGKPVSNRNPRVVAVPPRSQVSPP